MKKFIPLLLAVFAIVFVSCEKDPDMDSWTASIWFIPIMTRKQTSKLSKPITYRIASLLSATVKTPNIGKTKVHRKSSAHTLPI